MRKIVLTAIAIVALAGSTEAMPLTGASTLQSAVGTRAAQHAQPQAFIQVRARHSYQSWRDQDHGWHYGNRNWRSYSRAGQKCS